MRTHRNRISVMQTPKNDRRACNLDKEARPRVINCGGKTDYVPWISLTVNESFKSGEIEKRRGWECPHCGAPPDLGDGDDVPEKCWHCGSKEAAVFVDGTCTPA